jgi:ribosomal protein S24E
MAINISNAKNRDATVALEAVRPGRDVHYIDEDHNMVMTRRLLKTDVAHDLKELTKKNDDLGKLAGKLVKDDPEIDIEKFGMFLGETSRVYVSDKGIVHSVEEFEVITNPDGTVRERRPRKKELQNINSDVPLKWSGKFIKKKEAVKKFVFGAKKQLIHVNGLTYDFLFEIAKELHDKDSMMLMRGGEKGDKPLVLNRGGKPYNAFLEGRIDGDAYCLILHLSNMELKKPKPIEVDESEGEPEEKPKKAAPKKAAPKKTTKAKKAGKE